MAGNLDHCKHQPKTLPHYDYLNDPRYTDSRRFRPTTPSTPLPSNPTLHHPTLHSTPPEIRHSARLSTPSTAPPSKNTRDLRVPPHDRVSLQPRYDNPFAPILDHVLRVRPARLRKSHPNSATFNGPNIRPSSSSSIAGRRNVTKGPAVEPPERR